MASRIAVFNVSARGSPEHTNEDIEKGREFPFAMHSSKHCRPVANGKAGRPLWPELRRRLTVRGPTAVIGGCRTHKGR